MYHDVFFFFPLLLGANIMVVWFGLYLHVFVFSCSVLFHF